MLMNSVARLRIESHALGGPHALSLAQVDGIHTAQTTTFAASNGDERS